MARIVVAGYIVRYPLAGNVWAFLQYVVGLARLGHDVWFLEEASWENSCFDPERDLMSNDGTYGMRVLDGLLEHFGLPGRWAYRDWGGHWHGLSGEAVDDLVSGADLFLDIGGSCYFPQMHRARRRAYVDMDPAFTQFRAFGAHWRLGEYDAHFTYGANIGRRWCPIPTLGVQWHALRPPVLLDLWRSAPEVPPDSDRWTTVAHWTAYGACQFEGETYGQKDVEFMRIIELPRRIPWTLEIAVSGDEVPTSLLQANKWRLADPLAVSSDPWRYRDYIWASRGEFSVAKHAYVKTRSGWVSDRTATYLASGRPAVVQDTGLCDGLRTGRGLLVFQTLEEAAAALDTVEASYEVHRRSAQVLAEAHFDSAQVLTQLLDQCGL